MGTMITCRPATTADAAVVRALTIDFDRAAQSHLREEEFLARYDEIVASDDWLILLAEADGRAVGYALAQDYGPGLRRPFTVGRLYDTFVHPDARRRGVGEAIMDAVAAWAHSRGRPMILDWQSTPEAVRFYESCGYLADFEGDFDENPKFTLDTRTTRN